MRGREEGTEGQRGGRGWKKGEGYIDNCFLWSFQITIHTCIIQSNKGCTCSVCILLYECCFSLEMFLLSFMIIGRCMYVPCTVLYCVLVTVYCTSTPVCVIIACLYLFVHICVCTLCVSFKH